MKLQNCDVAAASRLSTMLERTAAIWEMPRSLSPRKPWARRRASGNGTKSAEKWSSRGGRAQPASLLSLLSVLGSDSLLARQPRHRFSCAPSDGRPLSFPSRSILGGRHRLPRDLGRSPEGTWDLRRPAEVTWRDVAFGIMAGRSSFHYNTLESKLLELAQKTQSSPPIPSGSRNVKRTSQAQTNPRPRSSGGCVPSGLSSTFSF